jgi:fructose-1,6-bisphosphatase/inositol monophosphatase family enzyme
VHAVIYDPLRDELFTASKGDGAFNDRRLRVTKRENLPAPFWQPDFRIVNAAISKRSCA